MAQTLEPPPRAPPSRDWSDRWKDWSYRRASQVPTGGPPRRDRAGPSVQPAPSAGLTARLRPLKKASPLPRSPGARRRTACAAALAAFSLVAAAPASAAPVLDLETLTGLEAQKLMAAGELTSVELTRAYVDRITALNKRGPGLNAVTQYNAQALNEARAADQRRRAGKLLGPADGLPVLMKDLIDVKGMYTSNGNYGLRRSFPAKDSGIVRKLRASGVVILGKLGLSEFANYFGSQPSGFSNLTGQVLSGTDADQNVSGSSSGSGAASAAALAALVIGTETSGSIISPSQVNGIVGLRPTVGLVPGIGIGPIAASQDTAGPMDRTVSNAALTLQSIAGPDAEDIAYHAGLWGPGVNDADVVPPVPAEVPDYLSALDLDYVKGKRIGFNDGTTNPVQPVPAPGTPLGDAYKALADAGAVLVPRPVINLSAGIPTGNILRYEAKRDITRYYENLGPDAPFKSLAEEIAGNLATPIEALKFGNGTHAAAQAVDISPDSAASVEYRNALVEGKRLTHKGIEDMLANATADPADDVIAILGSVNNGARAGYPQVTIPMGYNATQRRTLNVNVHGGAYDEKDLIGVAYVIEQGTKLRQPASRVNPSMYRCADTVPAPPFASRGGCNPDYDEAMQQVGTTPVELPFALENATAKGLQDRMAAGTLSAERLTKAYLSRIALANADGPAIQAVRALNPGAVAQAKALDAERAEQGARGPLHGIPVLVSDQVDVAGLPTTGGSVALQNSTPAGDSRIVSRLKAAGAIIIGKANVSELGGILSTTMPEAYSSLAGQVLLPSNTDVNPGGSSAGAATGTAAGFAALAVGMETSPDSAQLINPAALAGVVALKPTVGRVSRRGVLPVARSQDAPGPVARSVMDAATQLQVIAGSDPSDAATAGAPAVPSYTAGLTPTALQGKRVAVISSATAPYPSVVEALQVAGATTEVETIPAAPTTPSIVGREFKRDLNAHLGTTTGTGAKSLQAIIDYNLANPVEALKYEQGELLTAQAVDLADPATATAYANDRAAGDAATEELIDGVLANGTPGDTSDDFDVIVVPNQNALVGTADRAGYPVLTVPAGFSASRDPQGVTFVAGEFEEAKLLAAGYAFEQATRVRRAPSSTNPSMWRCVPGSAYDDPYNCHPGDRSLAFGFAAAPATPAEPATPATPADPGVTPAPPATPAIPAGLSVDSRQYASLRKALALELSRLGGLRFKEPFLTPGTARYSLRLAVPKRGAKRAVVVTLAKATLTKKLVGTGTATLRMSAASRRLLARYPKAKLTLRTTFKSASGKLYGSDRVVTR
ncbi:MAG: hypothetical protein JWO90_836 [Solirubrobacterales bacterium]|nr:hypothetical protein [Solirubrobacterales bacterium]